MGNRGFVNGFVVLCAGLLASSVSSLLETFNATDLARGFFDGLSVVAFGVAIVVLVRSRGATQG